MSESSMKGQSMNVRLIYDGEKIYERLVDIGWDKIDE